MTDTGRRRGGDQRSLSSVDMSRGQQVTLPPAAPVPFRATGKKLWALVVHHAVWLKETDAPALIDLCHLEDELAAVRKHVAKVDRAGEAYVPNRSGTLTLHPAIGRVRDLEKQRMSLMQALGLTPLDRVRLGIEEVHLTDELEAFRQRSKERRQ